nr:hypothetical protein [Thermoleptolyngbya sp. M55_K2018_002]
MHWINVRWINGSKQFAIAEACVIGLVSGLAAVMLKQSVGWLGGWRVQWSHQFTDWLGSWWSGWLRRRQAAAFPR